MPDCGQLVRLARNQLNANKDSHQLAVTVSCVLSFFDACLKGKSVSRLNIYSSLYPEIEVLE